MLRPRIESVLLEYRGHETQPGSSLQHSPSNKLLGRAVNLKPLGCRCTFEMGVAHFFDHTHVDHHYNNVAGRASHFRRHLSACGLGAPAVSVSDTAQKSC